MNLITTTSELQNFCEQIREEDADSFIAVDSEFLRIDTYRPKLCLIQVAGSKALAGIDALAKGINLKPLFEVFQDTKITKVFHAARQDLEILYHMSKDIPQPLFDTQVAAMVCGSNQAVWLWIGQYNRDGPDGLRRHGRGGRRWSYLTWDQEKELLRSLENRAQAGEIITAKQMLPEIEALVGAEVSKGYVYKLLRRHDWRKLGPRPRHVKADTQAQEEFKKNFRPLSKQ